MQRQKKIEKSLKLNLACLTFISILQVMIKLTSNYKYLN